MLSFLSHIAHAALGLLIGAILGSFVNALSYRLPRGISMIAPRSSCPSCKTILGVRDLMPIFSWLANRGRCRYCRVQFGARYLYVELAMAGLCAFAFVLLWDNWFLLPVIIMIASAATRIVMMLEKKQDG